MRADGRDSPSGGFPVYYPYVVGGARSTLEAAGLIDRCALVSCDFFASVPSGGDAYLLKSVIHDWDDAQAVLILKNCHRAMVEQGRLLLVEFVIPEGNGNHPGGLGWPGLVVVWS